MDLFNKLEQHHKENIYPYHMPGHKRKPLTKVLERVSDLDITEIDGFDNLNHPEDILLDMQKHAAQVYGAEESFYLTGGSTLGILSAVSAVTDPGNTILIGRNCHKAMYHAAYIRQLNVEYVYPKFDADWQVYTYIDATQIKEKLESCDTIKAVVIVSPTYEGYCSNIYEIAELVHSYGKILIVDEAHGAHFRFHDAWPHSAVKAGADIVIQSLHKTLPSMTQTAILHVCGPRIDREKLRRCLSVYQTSSPSYVFMASIEESIAYMETHGYAEMENFRELWINLHNTLQSCEYVEVSDHYKQQHDIGKLLISARKAGIDGQMLHTILRERFSLQMEMAQGEYVLAMFTVADRKDAYDRLTEALLVLDEEYKQEQVNKSKPKKSKNKTVFLEDYLHNEKECELFEAWDRDYEWSNLGESVSKSSADFINLYPPGIPLVVPGEILSQNMVNIIREYCVLNLPVQGIRRFENEVQVKVLKRK